MPQKTNLNINPYYDDFTKDDNFHRVLFRPGRPVQARELTTLQSILQNQIDTFGSHIFKEGSMVIPGNVDYDNEYFSAKLDSEHLGLPVSLYIDKLKGTKLKGQNSGIEVLVTDYKLPSDSDDITDVTLFIKYLSANDDNVDSRLTDAEPLLAQQSITYGNTTIDVGESVANLISSNATATGSAVHIAEGVYFIRGNFVNVSADTLILDPYSNNPSYRVGLNILESIITAKEDNSLYDNARGFSNYAAPGADRLKITTTLAKKDLNDFNDGSFIEIVKLSSGDVKKIQDTSVYAEIAKEFARRTFEESGNYSIGNFNVNVSESLNDNISNEGIFQPDQITVEGNTPSDDLACVEVESGKAYIKGYRVDRDGTTIVDIPKSRDIETIEKSKIKFDMGTLIRVNNVSGTPLIEVANSNNNIVKLYDLRKATGVLDGPPTNAIEIGQARVYSFGLTNTPYVDSSSEWDLRLFDIQTYTKLQLNLALTSTECPISTFIRGANSGASGYVVSLSGRVATLSQTSGNFISGEKLLINETDEYSRTVDSITVYGARDIKSVYQDSTALGLKKDFTADTVLKEVPLFTGSIEVAPDGTDMAGTIKSNGNTFTGVKVGSIVKYQSGDFSAPTKSSTSANFNRVTAISADLSEISVSGIGSVVGVCTGFVGVATGSGISLVVPEILNSQTGGLYSPIDIPNVSNLDLSNSELAVTTQIKDETADGNGKLTASVSNITGITSCLFSDFDPEKYSVIYADGTVESLTSDQVTFLNGFTDIEIEGLKTNQSNNVTVNVTVEKQIIKEKVKQFNRSNQLIVDKTNSGISTTITGLSTSKFYGLRVEDKEISLNVPDVYKICGIFESKNTSNPTLDKLGFVSGLALDTNVVVGEKIIGNDTTAIAQVVNVPSPTEVEIVYLNSNIFTPNEVVTFQESNIITTLQSISLGNNLNITNNYSLDTGNREQYCDYSRIVRIGNRPAPTKKILVVYDCYKVPTDDTGDVFTVNSYSKDRYSKDIPILANGVRASDTLDFRPRVPEFSASDKSPFAFTSRDFISGNGTTPSLVISTEETSTIGLSYYLPRIDKLILGLEKDSDGNNSGKFSLIKGVSSLNPKEPELIDDAMHIASIHLPAYLYDAKDAKISLIDNKRYTMRDIGKLDDRLTNLETVTSLSLLELDTKSFQIQDADGFDRFKTGFFVDDFKDAERMDFNNPDHKIDIDPSRQEMLVPIDRATFKPELGVAESYDVGTCDFSQNLDLLDSNVQKTGELVTLKYTEEEFIKNAFASHIENVNPFTVVRYTCDIKLTPQSDNWTRTIPSIIRKTRVVWGDYNGELPPDDILIGTRPDDHIRSRNVGFHAVGLKPKIRYYPFFDSRSGIDIVPKLIKIRMVSGSFEIDETIRGYGLNSSTVPNITFRAAQPNHKTGAYNNPETFYYANPYDPTVDISAVYTESSTILNVDIASLCEDAQGDYHGRVSTGMRFKGESSGATAVLDYTVEAGNPVQLISDSFGALSGSFFIREPNSDPPPPLRFPNGTCTFRLTSSSTNQTISAVDSGGTVTQGEAEYTTNGTIRMVDRTPVVIRIPPPPPPHDDPLAQSFTTGPDGMFASSVDVYFAEKDEFQPITCEIVTVELGTPTNQVLQGYAQVQLDPQALDSTGTSIIKTSLDASIATNIKFPSPVYLEPNTEYALVLRAGSSNAYKVWCSRMGEPTIETRDLDAASQSIIGDQYIGGSLFKSQNATIWTPSQYEDLKFTLYQCNFETSGRNGTLTLYNPSLEYKNVNFKTGTNAIETFSRKLKVGITLNDKASLLNVLTPGREVSASASGAPAVSVDATGLIEQIGGPINKLSAANAGIGTTNGGSGYGGSTHNGVPLFTITGNGSGATGNVTVSNGKVTNVAIANTGSGYVVGDVLGITTSSLTAPNKKGTGAEITIDDVWGVDTLYLSNVKGEKLTTNNYLVYTKDDGTTSTGAATTVITSSTVNGSLYEGNVIKVDQYNHGLTSDNNKVILSNIEPDTIPTTLTADLSLTGTTISVASTATFANFEGITTSRGYAKVGNEIIFYDGIGSGTLSISQRAFGDSVQDAHFNGDSISAYQFNNISLTGINTTHDMITLPNALNDLKTIDSYYITASRTGRTNLPDRNGGKEQLSFAENSFGGGDYILSTQNHQYNTFIPSFNVLVPGTETTLTAQLRSVSGTSAGGTEVSYIDQGFESVNFNQINRLSSPRILCSRVNETTKLTSLPRNKSVTLNVNFSTTNPVLSPVLDLDNAAFRLWRNRLNDPISDYTTDSRSNALTGDPHASCYISQVVNLKQPATSLKLIVGAYRHVSADFRVLYRLLKPDSSEVTESYNLFPGYNNINEKGEVIDSNLNDGRPDVFVPASLLNQFKDYEFTINDEDEFTGFQIKIVMSGDNEAFPPKFKDLRAIALA